MTPDTRDAHLDAWLERWLDAGPADRDAVLAACAAESPALAADLRDLTRLTDRAAPVLEAGAIGDALWRDLAVAEAPTTLPDDLRAGTRIGAWQIVRSIGRGGMGAVYLVQRIDGGFAQQAALKLVRDDDHAGSIARRFETERAILASLTHAGIARLIDGGRTLEGRPYFVMEYVDGQPIHRHADERGLSIDRRLDLFAQVCLAVQHAHQQLVVHGDVKPSNIVVTAEGTVKLLDFGIAAVLAGPADAGAAGRLLTPHYASPEQVRGGPVGIASDVYQLGLLLAELLTGHRAQVPASLRPDDLVRTVCEVPVPRPSEVVSRAPDELAAAARGLNPRRLARRLGGDLDAIVLLATRKEPSQRYASVGALLDDLQRVRDLRPVAARGSSRLYRASRFVRRHRLALASAAGLIAALSWFLPTVALERLRTRAEARRAEQVEHVLSGLFPLPTQSLGDPPRARDYVDTATALVRRELSGHPGSQGRLFALLGRSYNLLGLYGQGRQLLTEAVSLRERDRGADGVDVADTRMALAESLHYLGRYDEAAGEMERALAARLAGLGVGHPQVAAIELDLGDLHHTRGALTEAERVLRSGLAVIDEALRPSYLHARARRDLANVLRDRGHHEQAERLYRDARARLAASTGAADVQVALTDLYYGRLLVMAGRPSEAEVRLVPTLRTLRRAFEGDHPLTGIALQQIGFLRAVQGRYSEADAALRESSRVLTALVGAAHPMVTRTRVHQAELARLRGDAAAAIREAGRALTDLARLGLAAHPAAVDACLVLGRAASAWPTPPAADPRLAACLGYARREFVPDDPRTRLLEALVADGPRGRR